MTKKIQPIISLFSSVENPKTAVYAEVAALHRFHKKLASPDADSGLESGLTSPDSACSNFHGIYTYEEREQTGAYRTLQHQSDFLDDWSDTDEELQRIHNNVPTPGAKVGHRPRSGGTSPFDYVKGSGRSDMVSPQWDSVVYQATERRKRRLRLENERKTARASISPHSNSRVKELSRTWHSKSADKCVQNDPRKREKVLLEEKPHSGTTELLEPCVHPPSLAALFTEVDLPPPPFPVQNEDPAIVRDADPLDYRESSPEKLLLRRVTVIEELYSTVPYHKVSSKKRCGTWDCRAGERIHGNCGERR